MYYFHQCFTMFIFGILSAWKRDFWSFVNRSYQVNNFGYTCVGIRYIFKDPFFLIINSDYYSNNKRIPLLMCCISLSNDESLIYVLDCWVITMFIFAIWPRENAISDHSSTGLIKSINLDTHVFGLEIFGKTTTFSMLTQIGRVVIHEYHI